LAEKTICLPINADRKNGSIHNGKLKYNAFLVKDISLKIRRIENSRRDMRKNLLKLLGKYFLGRSNV
jgi:hypothetical protein